MKEKTRIVTARNAKGHDVSKVFTVRFYDSIREFTDEHGEAYSLDLLNKLQAKWETDNARHELKWRVSEEAKSETA